MDAVDADADKHNIKLTAARKKLLKDRLAKRDETAFEVISKIHKPSKSKPDPLRGLFEMTVEGKRCVVEYEPDSELRDTEQIPLLEEGGIEAFIRREVLPYAPDAWFDQESHQDRLRSQLHAPLLQAAAVAHARRDQRRHPRIGEGD